MNITEIVVGDRVLIQPSEYVKEVAKVVGWDNGLVIVKRTNNEITNIAPAYILKSFGQ